MRILLFLFLLIASLGFGQDNKALIAGRWYQSNHEDGGISNEIELQRDSCEVNYLSNGFNVRLRTTYDFNVNNFMVDSETGDVLGVFYSYPYWEIQGNHILLGKSRDKLIPSYEIMELSSTKLVLKRLA